MVTQMRNKVMRVKSDTFFNPFKKSCKISNSSQIKHHWMLCIAFLASIPPRPSEISEKKMEHIGKVIFDIPFKIQSHAESMMKILGAL